MLDEALVHEALVHIQIAENYLRKKCRRCKITPKCRIYFGQAGQTFKNLKKFISFNS
jgi:hypothetical protein